MLKSSVSILYVHLIFWNAKLCVDIRLFWRYLISFLSTFRALNLVGLYFRSLEFSGAEIREKYCVHRLKTFHKPRKDFITMIIFEFLRPRIASVLCYSIYIRTCRITCAK